MNPCTRRLCWFGCWRFRCRCRVSPFMCRRCEARCAAKLPCEYVPNILIFLQILKVCEAWWLRICQQNHILRMQQSTCVSHEPSKQTRVRFLSDSYFRTTETVDALPFQMVRTAFFLPHLCCELLPPITNNWSFDWNPVKLLKLDYL